MNGLICTNGKVLYFVVKQALRNLHISFQRDNTQGVLVWSDAVRLEFFDSLRPYQVINRLPFASTWARKVPFVRLLQRIQQFYPQQYKFLPKSYVLPKDEAQFKLALEAHDKYYIYKPDRGSLGHGIRLIAPDMQFKIPQRLAVAQEYIEAYTIDNLKFDLRIYVLISSITPLQIFIYRNGVARFCTEDSGTDSKYSFLTNTAINAKNPDAVPEKMTRMIATVFEQMRNNGVDIRKLWRRIDDTIILTVISAYNYLSKMEKEMCPNTGISRCFQIFGCDILLDKNLNPYILEINHRPSMKTNTDDSKHLKINMLEDAIKLASPLHPLQKLLQEKDFYPETHEEMHQLLKENPKVVQEIKSLKSQNMSHNSFEQIYPNNNQMHNAILAKVKSLPTDFPEEFELEKTERLNSQPVSTTKEVQ